MLFYIHISPNCHRLSFLYGSYQCSMSVDQLTHLEHHQHTNIANRLGNVYRRNRIAQFQPAQIRIFFRIYLSQRGSRDIICNIHIRLELLGIFAQRITTFMLFYFGDTYFTTNIRSCQYDLSNYQNLLNFGKRWADEV